MTKVAIVDDSPNIQLILETYLEEIGIQDRLVLPDAESLFEGIESDGRDSPELILMDLNLPGMSGLEATQRLRKEWSREELPVLAITGNNDDEVLREAFEMGCIDFIPKPIKKVELHARVQSALRLKEVVDELTQKNDQLEEAKDKLRKVNARLEARANHDDLTGLCRKRHFHNLLRREWNRAVRQKSPLSMVMIDIDHFKAYNDEYGHKKGDEAIVHVADAIEKAAQRATDVAGRYGGEEFVVLLPETPQEGCERIAKTICPAVQELNIEHREAPEGILTISCGTATIQPSEKMDGQVLIEQADEALYRAKEKGRNCVATA